MLQNALQSNEDISYIMEGADGYDLLHYACLPDMMVSCRSYGKISWRGMAELFDMALGLSPHLL